MATAATPGLSTNQTREAFRSQHNVRLVTTQEEGRGFAKLPGGVYGFTFAPATETPIFEKAGTGAYEVHKLPNGSGRLIIYCTPEQAAALAAGVDSVQLDVYPDSFQSATVSVALPMDWIHNEVYKVVRRPGNPVTLRVSSV